MLTCTSFSSYIWASLLRFSSYIIYMDLIITERIILNLCLHMYHTWTRQNRKNTTEKSIIDYILVSSTQKRIIENIEIDELGTLRIKGKNDTDHNTITATILTECSNPHVHNYKKNKNKQQGGMGHIQQQNKRNGTK